MSLLLVDAPSGETQDRTCAMSCRTNGDKLLACFAVCVTMIVTMIVSVAEGIVPGPQARIVAVRFTRLSHFLSGGQDLLDQLLSQACIRLTTLEVIL